MRQRRPRTVAHLKTCLQEEWDKITPETLHHLVSSVPKRLFKCLWKGMATLQSGKCFTVPTFLECVCRFWMTGKDVHLQMTWSWPDKTWNILCSYCLQWNTSQSKFRNHYFLFLFAFSILSQLFLIWGCRLGHPEKIPNKLWCSSTGIWTQHGPKTSQQTNNRTWSHKMWPLKWQNA